MGKIEPLEARIAPANVIAHWIGGDGNWSDPAHWDLGNGKFPNNSGGDTYTAIIDLAASDPLITVDRDISINALTNSETLRITSGTSTLLASLANTGTIEVSGTGTLNLAGNFTTANLGTVHSKGGTVNLSGVLDNTGATLALDATTGSWNLGTFGTIKGGRITTAGGATLVLGFGTLDGVTLGSDLTVPNRVQLTVKNGLTLDNARLTLANIGSNTYLNFNGTQTLGGTGELFFGGTTTVVNSNTVQVRGDGTQAGAATLTIGPAITIHGSQNGEFFGQYSFDKIVNQGTIDADAAGKTMGTSKNPVTADLVIVRESNICWLLADNGKA